MGDSCKVRSVIHPRYYHIRYDVDCVAERLDYVVFYDEIETPHARYEGDDLGRVKV